MELQGEEEGREGVIPELDWQKKETKEEIVIGEKVDKVERDDGGREIRKLIDP